MSRQLPCTKLISQARAEVSVNNAKRSVAGSLRGSANNQPSPQLVENQRVVRDAGARPILTLSSSTTYESGAVKHYLQESHLSCARIFNQKKLATRRRPCYFLAAMKIATSHSTMLVSGEVESVEMTLSKRGIIAATRMFRDQIYKHKLWAVVREIICNGIDEHRKHKITRPLRITVPTAGDPHFRVRDFGKGLSKEKVFSVFFQYFESTKDQENDSIGGFGIGAKSPLAYADTFTVESFHGGSKTSYVATLDGEASQAHKMDLQDSSETGIEVCVPIEEWDFSKCRDLIQYFVDNAKFDNFEFVGAEIKKQERGAWIISNKFGRVGNYSQMFRASSNIYAQVGDVVYPIDNTHEIRNPFYQSVFLELENGSVDIHPSREALELSKRNIFLINQGLTNLSNEASQEYIAAFQKAKTAREKCKVQGISSIFRSLPAKLSSEMPATIRVPKGAVNVISWDASQFERANRLDFMRRYYVHSDLQADFQIQSKPASFLLTGDNVVRTHEIIAYAEANKIPSPVVCVGHDKIPQGWVVGSDLWLFDPAKVDAAAAKAVRKRYASPQAKVARPIDPNATLGYSGQSYSYYWRIAANRFKQGVTYIKLDFDNPEIVPNVIDLAISLGMSVVPAYVCKSHQSAWKKDRLPQGFNFMEPADFLKKLEKEAQAFVNKHARFVPNNGLSLSHGIGQKYRVEPNHSEIAKRIAQNFPKLQSQKVHKEWQAAQKRWDALPDFERELALFQKAYSCNLSSYPALKDKVEKIWGKVFV